MELQQHAGLPGSQPVYSDGIQPQGAALTTAPELKLLECYVPKCPELLVVHMVYVVYATI